MANDNNKAHELAAGGEEDTTELETLPRVLVGEPADDYESEADAATCSFESLEGQHRDASLATLRSELERREYELEHLRVRRDARLARLEARIVELETELAEAAGSLADAR